ncbi:hypothetical protein [Modestobacter sp. NPDC049651]|uniref:hypothetical protein n=1 Tax=unclassified Modestobacter TaxID=2643866 RepID=UPI0033C395E0
MRTRLLLVTAVTGLALGLTGCASGGDAASGQEARNAAAQQLAAAQRATLVPVAARIEALGRSGEETAELDAYRALARSVAAAGSASDVRALVAGSGLALGRSAGDVPAAG